MFAVVSKSERKQKLRERHKAWLADLAERQSLTLTAIARAAGLDQSALTRFMNDDERGATLDSLTIAAVMEATGAPAPFEQAGTPTANGLAEREAEPYRPTPTELAMAPAGAEHLAWFILKARTLEYEGYRPGDRMIVDINRSPNPGDIVCAQFYNWQKPQDTQTVFRLYEPPSLLTAGPVDNNRRARLIDGENVIVKGVLRAMVRLID